MINGFKRIGAVLSADENEPYEGYHVLDDGGDKRAISLKDASFSWDVFDDEEENGEEEDNKPENKNRSKKSKRRTRKSQKPDPLLHWLISN